MYGCLSCVTTTVADEEEEAAGGGAEDDPGEDEDGGGGGGGGGGGDMPPLHLYHVYDSIRKKNKSETPPCLLPFQQNKRCGLETGTTTTMMERG